MKTRMVNCALLRYLKRFGTAEKKLEIMSVNCAL